MPAAPEVVNDVFEAVGENASVAYAPGSINLLGEECACSGGLLLAHALPVYAAVGVEEIDDEELRIVFGREETSMPLPDAVPDAFAPIPTAVAAVFVALQHSLHIVPRTRGGLKVTIASTIPARRGFGEIPAIQSALALALNARFGDRDDVPTRTRMAAAIHSLMVSHEGDYFPDYPYTASLRSKPDSILCINHADEAVTQTVRPNSLEFLLAYSPEVTCGSPNEERSQFFKDACTAFGVSTLSSLPDAQTRVLDWVNARHQVQPDTDAPTLARASRWLDEASGSSDRARAVIGNVRHSNIDAVLDGVARDVRERGTIPSEGSALAGLIENFPASDDTAVVRAIPAPGAALLVWASASAAADVLESLTAAGAKVLAIANTSAGAVVA